MPFYELIIKMLQKVDKMKSKYNENFKMGL